MSFESIKFKKLDNLRTHPRRVTKRDAFMASTVRPMILVLADIMAVGRHLYYSPFLNPHLHDRRPIPQIFYRQKKSFQAAYHGSTFARTMRSQKDARNGIVTRHPFFVFDKTTACETST